MRKPRKTNIDKGQWWDRAWSLVDGCTPVSEGCDRCSAEAMARRFKRDWTPRFREDRLILPLRARKPAVWAIWNDLFHESVTARQIFDALFVMGRSQRHTYMVLTKRPGRFAALGDAMPKPLSHVALGVTVESQDHVGRVGELLNAWPGLTFVSVEPMLSRLDITPYLQTLDLVICGGETGPGARPMHPDWPRSLRDQCQAAGAPFWFKGWGEWAPFDRLGDLKMPAVDFSTARSYRVGKKRAGRLLDSVEHSEWFRIEIEEQ